MYFSKIVSYLEQYANKKIITSYRIRNSEDKKPSEELWKQQEEDTKAYFALLGFLINSITILWFIDCHILYIVNYI